MSVHIVIATFKFKTEEGKRKVLDILGSEDGLKKTRTFKGFISIDINESNTDENKLVFFQKWETQKDHENYLEYRKSTTLFNDVMELLLVPFTVERFTRVDV